MDEQRRVVLFGLYAGSGENGFSYLIDISPERLIQLTDQYDMNMAQLDADEQATVLDIATKTYLDALDGVIHDRKMEVEADSIDSRDKEFDAKFAALDADKAEIETLKERVTQAISKADAEIAILTARIAEQAVDAKYVDVDILKKELEAERAKMRVLEAGLKGLNLQLDIANAAVDKSEIALKQQKAKLDTSMVPVQVTELGAQATNLEADKMGMETRTDLLDSEIARMAVDKKKIELDSLDELDPEIKRIYDKLGIPLGE
jgi:chromosome segregation ATPase